MPEQITIEDALQQMNERKAAITSPGGMIEGEDEIRMLASGLEIPIDEMAMWSSQLAIAVMQAAREGNHPATLVKGACMDGFLLGVAFERMRGEQ
jgi:hypothetical protein